MNLYQSSNGRKGSLFQTIIKTCLLVGFYYIFSIGLTFYNKWMFKDFKYPLMTTCFHFLFVFIYSTLTRIIFSSCREQSTMLDWSTYLKRVFVTGIVSALDIGLSNWSFVFITVSLYTMVKSTAVLFIMAFAIVFKLEKARWSLIIVVFFISAGLFMFVYKSSQFNLEGFILVLLASFTGGIRWTLTQILSQKEELGLTNPIDLMFHLMPTMFIGLFPLALARGGKGFFTTEHLFGAGRYLDILPTAFQILGGGILAFMLSTSEYLLLSQTSSLTLSISGIVKEILTLTIATTYNGDKLSLLNWGGCITCLAGISLHVYLKFKDNDNDKLKENSRVVKMSLLAQNSSDESEDEIFSYSKR